VPELTMMLGQAAIDVKTGPLQDFTLNDQEFYELKIAGWLHDCGKVITPESVMDKPTKLSTIFDRITLIDQRFELLKKQAECNKLNKIIELMQSEKSADVIQKNLTEIDRHFSEFIQRCDADRDFLRKSNIGSELMAPEDQQRVRDLAAIAIVDESGEEKTFLSQDEVYNLNITRGTLTAEERQIINNHIVVTINMLESLPYPKGLKRVPEYAGGHHERMDGKGYPRGLTREQMSIPARVMGIADIFEALTSKDRPYKKAKTLSESLFILGKMKIDSHIDPDLFDLFVREKIYLKYALQFLEPEQIDEVDESKIPGYTL